MEGRLLKHDGTNQPSDCKTRGERIGKIFGSLSGQGNNILSVRETPNDGVFVTPKEHSPSVLFRAGDKILECWSTSVALDPPYRETHCAFCAHKISANQKHGCPKCRLVAICDACENQQCVQYHNLHECQSLQALIQAYQSVLLNTDTTNQSTSNEDESLFLLEQIDPSIILTVRTLCRRYYDQQLSSEASYFPPITWDLLDELCGPSNPENDSFLRHLWSLMSTHSLPWMGGRKAIDDDSLFVRLWKGVVVCGHAITDVSLPLGQQCLGRGLFLEHSFYNHSCVPNAQLSCVLMTTTTTTRPKESHRIGVLARTHLLRSITAAPPITLSYIPISGLDRGERQRLLRQRYHFACQCPACSSDNHDQPNRLGLVLPKEVDIDSIREIQYSVNQELVGYAERDEKEGSDATLQRLESLVRMTQRGIKNQGHIPPWHEVSLEAHRLLAKTYSLWQRQQEALVHHEEFLRLCDKKQGNNNNNTFWIDPNALATQHLECSHDYEALIEKTHASHNNAPSGQNDQDWEQEKKNHESRALEILSISLGTDHPWVSRLAKQQQEARLSCRNPPAKKKPRQSL